MRINITVPILTLFFYYFFFIINLTLDHQVVGARQ